MKMTKITAQLATIPARERFAKEAVKSLLPQVDKIRIALNNYSYDGVAGIVPDWLDHPKIERIYCDNSKMDGYKFLDAHLNDGYVLICDDDILYPPDFAETMVKHLNFFSHPTVLSIMGKNLMPRPMESYANGRHEFFRAFEMHTHFKKCELIGMCGAIYHTRNCKVNETDMVITDSDVCMSVYCDKNRIDKYVVPHAGEWCKDLMEGVTLESDGVRPAVPTMWMHNKLEKRDKQITKYINDNLGKNDSKCFTDCEGEEGDSFAKCVSNCHHEAHDDEGRAKGQF